MAQVKKEAVKTVQLPVSIWAKLQALAQAQDRNISSYLRTHIAEQYDLLKK